LRSPIGHTAVDPSAARSSDSATRKLARALVSSTSGQKRAASRERGCNPGAQPAPRTRTIDLTLVQTGGFDSPGPPRPGFVHAFTDKITGDNGITGHHVGLCTPITSTELLCHSQVIQTSGQLSYQGILHQPDRNTPGTILGGTGAYNGARGTARITDINPTTTKVTVTLIG
jgi:hypothetical protein